MKSTFSKLAIVKNLRENFNPLLKYCIVGASGTFIDIGSLYLFVEYAHFSVIPASMLSFLLAVSNNFIFNKIWTFKNTSKNYRKLYIKFLIVSLVGLGLTVTSMYILVNILKLWYILAKALVSLLVLTWNFLTNKVWTFRLKQKSLHIPDIFKFDLSIVIPAFNEENRIKNTLSAIQNFMEEKKINAEIIVVNDKSINKTPEIVEKLQQKIPHLRLINLDKNRGKGFAIKQGIEKSRGRLILFTDADNSTPIEEFEKLLQKMQHTKAHIVIGSRYLHDSNIQIKQPTYRVIIGRLGNFLIRLFLLDGIKDTQCGFKLFEHKVAREVFSFQKVKRFGFDMETLVVAKNLGYTIIEVPVSWFNSPESRVRPIKDTFITLKDLFYIKLNLLSGRYNEDHVSD